jgi:hypothetical protein
MAGAKRSAKGSRPNRRDSATHAETAPGTVTLSQPIWGISAPPAKRAGVHPAGARPEALRPCSARPSHRIAKASEPTPLPVGSTTVSAMAAASAASTALPPASSMRSPACAARGWEVATTFRAYTGTRREG